VIGNKKSLLFWLQKATGINPKETIVLAKGATAKLINTFHGETQLQPISVIEKTFAL
jgi:hypothetical protein